MFNNNWTDKAVFGLALVCLLGIPINGLSQEQTSSERLPLVAPMDWSVFNPNNISLEEAYVPFSQDHSYHGRSLAYFLGHFHQLANAVRDTEPNKGFIDIAVWRPRSENVPENGRIMDNILSMAWIYTKNEPWNPYYGDDATRLRLETAIRYWATLQDERGQFSTNFGSTGITMFTTKFMSEALILLKDGPEIDPEVVELVRSAIRKALLFSFNDEHSWLQGTRFSNQYGNLFAGGLAYLSIFDDEEVARDLRRALINSHEFMSPAGYFYEGEGPDWGYYFGTHHTNIHSAWEYGRNKIIDGTDIGEILREEYALSADWLAYNSVPDGDRFYLNRSVETRSNMNNFSRLEIPISEVVPIARAFHVTREEYEAQLQTSHANLVKEWGNPPALNQYRPYDFQFRNHHKWFPTRQERDEAFMQLPYIASDRFIHQRRDDIATSTYTYVRRPEYYAIFNSGPIIRNGQRMGLGLIWHPKAGVILQSQSGSSGDSWGTRLLGDNVLIESGRIDPALFEIDDQIITPEPGIKYLQNGNLKVIYGGHLPRFLDKSLVFNEDNIGVSVSFVNASQRFVEQIPLMLDVNDRITVQNNELIFSRDGEIIFVISFTGSDQIVVGSPQTRGDLSLTWVSAIATGSLEYVFSFNSEPTSIEKGSIEIPVKTELKSIYPNPFNPGTIIPFVLANQSRVNLDVYNMKGRLVKNLVNDNLGPGQHEIYFDASNFSSGVYMVRLLTNDQESSRLITLIK
jgi:uncharacterized SAM-binding protein YcdF (DUF218 family)